MKIQRGFMDSLNNQSSIIHEKNDFNLYFDVLLIKYSAIGRYATFNVKYIYFLNHQTNWWHVIVDMKHHMNMKYWIIKDGWNVFSKIFIAINVFWWNVLHKFTPFNVFAIIVETLLESDTSSLAQV